jgi:hypothetical protein
VQAECSRQGVRAITRLKRQKTTSTLSFSWLLTTPGFAHFCARSKRILLSNNRARSDKSFVEVAQKSGVRQIAKLAAGHAE